MHVQKIFKRIVKLGR